MSGATGFGRFFGGGHQPDSAASEIPPLLRPPAPPAENENPSAPIPFRTGRVLEPPPHRVPSHPGRALEPPLQRSESRVAEPAVEPDLEADLAPGVEAPVEE